MPKTYFGAVMPNALAATACRRRVSVLHLRGSKRKGESFSTEQLSDEPRLARQEPSQAGNMPIDPLQPSAFNLSEQLSSAVTTPVALVMLNLVTVLWGSQHALIKRSLESGAGMTPAELNLDRFVIAALIFLPFAPKLNLLSLSPFNGPRKASDSVSDSELGSDQDGVNTWKAGLELGVWMFAGYAMQSIGLQYTTASRSAFLLYLNVKLVPIFASVLYRRQIPLSTWASAALALLGTVLLGYDGTPPNVGDAWSVAAAAASALFILRLETATRQFDPAQLNAASMVSVAGLSLGWLPRGGPGSKGRRGENV